MSQAHSKVTAHLASRHQIIMQFTVPPGADDLMGIANGHLENLPEEILDKVEDLVIQIEDFPDTATEQEMDLAGPYDLLAVFRPASQIAPGVIKKVSKGDDLLILYRRPILDMWAESGDDLNLLVRQIMIGELGDALEFSDADIDDMINRHYQGML